MEFASNHRIHRVILLLFQNILGHLLTGVLHVLVVTNILTIFLGGPGLPLFVIGQKARTVGTFLFIWRRSTGGSRSWRRSRTPPTVFASIHRILLVIENILDHVLTGLLFFLLVTNFITTFCSGPELPRLVIGQKAHALGTLSFRCSDEHGKNKGKRNEIHLL